MTEIRIQKILAQRGVASRRFSEKLIEEGRVALNGVTVTELGTKADPYKDKITVDGILIPKEEANHKYFLLYKPAGYITSANDERGRRTVLDLVPKEDRLYPVGRLDYATSGILLITNDGELTNALLHPKGEINKTYACGVSGVVTSEQLRTLENGVKLADGMTSPAKAHCSRYNNGISTVIITIHEGRNRQVRRMMNGVGLEVVWLKRIGFAGLDLTGLKVSEYRELTDKEVKKLYELTGLEK